MGRRIIGILTINIVRFWLVIGVAGSTQANIEQSCLRVRALTLSDRALLAQVTATAASNRDAISLLPFGKEWLDYLNHLSQGDNLKQKIRLVNNSGAVAESLQYMREQLVIMVRAAPPQRPAQQWDVSMVLKQHLILLLTQLSNAPQVNRVDLYNAGNLFANIADFYYGNPKDPLYYSGAEGKSYLSSMLRTEAYLDEKYGKFSLPLPTPRRLTPMDFIKMEATGIVPLGLDIEAAEGPKRFFEHDEDHFADSTDFARNSRFPLSSNFSTRSPFDIELFVDKGRALRFLRDVLRFISSRETPVEQILAECVVFYMIHERYDFYAIADFNRTQLRRIARDLLGSEKKPWQSVHDFNSLLHSVSPEGEQGHLFTSPPSANAVRNMVQLIAQM